MFIYWDGFEIDGSDTDFNIVLPENVQVQEFVDCFLSVHIFNKDIEPSVSYYKSGKSIDISVDELKEKILTGKNPSFSIDVNCMHLERLPDDLRAKIYALSSRREPHEKAFGKVENPCAAPVLQGYYGRGEMTVQLNVCMPYKSQRDDFEFKGYVNNEELLRAATSQVRYCFEINVGPNFYYEYAIFIIDYLRDSFPGLGTWGGLDCANGWTDGCTYASSIYSYEKIHLPVELSVKNTLKKLTEYNIVRSYRKYYNKKWQREYEYTNGFFLANHAPVEQGKPQKPITFDEYVDLVETSFASDTDSFAKVCDTAAQIMLPRAEEFSQNPEAVKLLQAALPQIEDEQKEWNYTGYIAFTIVDEKPVCEFRVRYMMKEYFLTLLKLMDAGMIDFIKSVTYERRHD